MDFIAIFITIALFLVPIHCEDTEQASPEELVIETVSKPDKCDRKSARGDMLTMHYRGTLSDGSEFDARYTYMTIHSFINI